MAANSAAHRKYRAGITPRCNVSCTLAPLEEDWSPPYCDQVPASPNTFKRYFWGPVSRNST